MTKYLIFRLIRNDWNLIHMNVETMERAMELVAHAKAISRERDKEIVEFESLMQSIVSGKTFVEHGPMA